MPSSSGRAVSPPDPVTAYALEVQAGRIVAGPGVRDACARHLRDLEHAGGRGWRFDVQKATLALSFFPKILKLAGGEFEGTPFTLLPWQQFIVGSLFGWVGADGYRRFRTAYIEAGKGCGKSPLVAGIGLYMLIADGEPRAEVYAAASKKDQAMILFRDAVAMYQQSPSLAKALTASGTGSMTWNLAHHASGSFFRPISSDDGQSGPRPHCGIIDEFHEHKTGLVVDMMRAGTKSRRQALIPIITNSGVDRTSPCYQHHEYALKVAAGAIKNDSYFGYVCALDEGDDPLADEACWIKTNPSLPAIPGLKYLREQAQEARDLLYKRNISLRLNWCVWTQQSTQFIPLEDWDACADASLTLEAFRGLSCFVGMDLSSTTDTTALVLLAEDADGTLLWWDEVWLPGDRIAEREARDGVPYAAWIAEGAMRQTDGSVVDYGAIKARVREWGAELSLREIGFDPWNATQTAVDLEAEGFVPVQVRQGFATMSEPVKHLAARLQARTVRHRGNPVSRYQVMNLAVATDPAGNIKFDKGKATGRIDIFAAGVTGLSRLIATPDEGPSVYESRGVLVL